MRMNRRNVLVGLGTIVAGGGAALGTGAFTSVEANRTVSVTTEGDADAFVGIGVDEVYAVDGDSSTDVVEVSLEGSTDSDGFNENAITNIDAVLTLTNNAADGESIDISFGDVNNGGHSASKMVTFADTAEVTFTLATTETDAEYKELGNGDEVDVDVEVNTMESPSSDDTQLTIYAFDTDGS